MNYERCSWSSKLDEAAVLACRQLRQQWQRRRGAFHKKIGGAVLSTESQEMAAATDYGVAVGKVREYIGLLDKMAPAAGARTLSHFTTVGQDSTHGCGGRLQARGGR